MWLSSYLLCARFSQLLDSAGLRLLLNVGSFQPSVHVRGCIFLIISRTFSALPFLLLGTLMLRTVNLLLETHKSLRLSFFFFCHFCYLCCCFHSVFSLLFRFHVYHSVFQFTDSFLYPLHSAAGIITQRSFSFIFVFYTFSSNISM